ncbi:4-(cytidine 5'-diphospho)-2-C-methyl-D-erythritol kinase [Campylobacter sp. MIT 12-5580]|uniref:4-(cytidine 5'-diphospho)-2-C-methyl-D-erythritol kinase n=1 Tax=Campylobacter sp. MIT 12-5580 TaxID=2040651 RepID=UPI0010F760A6|nr:4-(cytidine 5'-diphospho)-2-C-methyl-D-erythritol kinase [Campylobacter sp. MIT 12-5580]TKX30286.1 4-(cytidine 5'-diphospho)-2-C-methyl-D-erythritol kinase [Campylobacter sp. MIT 12-5580]
MKAYAKANLFLKLIGLDERNYHLLHSRFILLEDFFDELFLSTEKSKTGFELISDFYCEDNIIFKAFNALCKAGFKNELEECFSKYSLKLIKNIPQGGGLGGGSSDAACFLMLMNETLNLKIPQEKLMQIGFSLGSDVPFFLSQYKCAHVSGTGQFITEFEDDLPKLEFIFPAIECKTPLIYQEFDHNPHDYKANEKLALKLLTLKNHELFEYKNTELNDLFTPCINLYPKMLSFMQENFFLSGSGSSVFKVV